MVNSWSKALKGEVAENGRRVRGEDQPVGFAGVIPGSVTGGVSKPERGRPRLHHQGKIYIGRDRLLPLNS